MNIEKIWRGEAGLAMTYWVYGVLGSTLFGIPFRLVNPGSAPAVITVLLFCAYFIWIGVGIWRAADKYEGPKIWTYFSKLFVAGPVAAAAIGIAVAILVPIFSVATQPGKSTVSGQISEPALAASEPAVQDRPQKSSAASAIPLTENRA